MSRRCHVLEEILGDLFGPAPKRKPRKPRTVKPPRPGKEPTAGRIRVHLDGIPRRGR